MFRMIVYGTLRPGCALFRNIQPLVKYGEVITDVTISGLRMYVLGQAPAAVLSNNQDDQIVADIIECDLGMDEEGLWRMYLNKMEGVPYTGYFPKRIGTMRGEALVYAYTLPIPKSAHRIYDWKEWQRKFEAMSPEEREKVLGKSARIQLVSMSERPDYCG